MRRAKRPPRSLVAGFACPLVRGFMRLLVCESARLLVRRATCSRIHALARLQICVLARWQGRLSADSWACSFANLRACLFAGALVSGSARPLVCKSACWLVRRATCPRVHVLARWQSHLFTLLPAVARVTIVRARRGGFAPAPRPRGHVRSPRVSRPEWCRRPRWCRRGFRGCGRRFRS